MLTTRPLHPSTSTRPNNREWGLSSRALVEGLSSRGLVGGLSSRALVEGFTLIELMIGLVIMGLVMALAMPSYRAWIENTRIRNTAESIMNGLQKARQEAVHLNSPVKFVLTGTGWSIGCETPTATCPDPIESKSAHEGASSSINVIASSGTTVTFDQFGRRKTPAAAAGTITFDIDSTTLPAADSRELRITINTGGSSRMCDPNVSVSTDPRYC